MNDPNRPGFNPNKLASQTQRDLNKGFGSLFGSSLGEQTQLGRIKEQKPDALSGMDTAALNAFSLLGGGLPSLMANVNWQIHLILYQHKLLNIKPQEIQ